MKSSLLTLILITILFQAPYSVAALKIQINDSWKYESGAELYKENVIEIVQYQPTIYDEAIAIAKVETNRMFSFPIGYSISQSGHTVTINAKIYDDGVLYLTQEGGIPLFGNHTIIGTIDIQHKNGSFYQIPIDQPIYWINGQPDTVFSSTSTVAYNRYTALHFLYIDYENQAIASDVGIRQYYVISTNNDQTDKIREYTITETSREISIGLPDLDININFQGQSEETATQFTWNQNKKIPTYIKQTEPANIESASPLKLNQELVEIEYHLLIEDDGSFLPFSNNTFYISLIILLIVINGLKIRKPRPLS